MGLFHKVLHIIDDIADGFGSTIDLFFDVFVIGHAHLSGHADDGGCGNTGAHSLDKAGNASVHSFDLLVGFTVIMSPNEDIILSKGRDKKENFYKIERLFK